eukprot:symbB.v1.2.040940.t1/scaffold7672.1/size10676/1
MAVLSFKSVLAATGRSFNEQVVIDLIYIYDITGETHTILSTVDDASHYHALQRLENRSAENVISDLIKGWFRFFGPPENILLDAEGAMKSFDFQEMSAQAGCTMRFVPADAHWQLGRAERHGAVAKEIANRLIVQHGVQTAEDIEMAVTMAGFAKNQLIQRAGVRPSQWVFGRSPRIPGALISEGSRVEDKQMLSNSKKLQRTELMRLDAMKTFLEIEMSNKLRTAMLRKSRPFRGGFEIGQRLAYWRVRNTLDGEGPFAGYRQGVLIGMDPGPRGSLWIRNDRGRLVQVAREQARALEEEEAWMPGNPDFRLLRDAEQDLSDKHAIGFDQRQGAIEDMDKPPLLALPEVQPVLDADGRPAAATAAPPIIVQPQQQRLALLPSGPSTLPQQAAGDTITAETKKNAEASSPGIRQSTEVSSLAIKQSADAGSLAFAGEVPKRAKKQHPSQPPSRAGSSDATLVDITSIAAESEAADVVLPPVPESIPSEAGSQGNRRIDQQGQFHEEGQTMVEGDQIFQVHAKAYCQLCGSVNKIVECGVTRCGRCMNSTFTDESREVLNWFDEEEKYDTECKRMSSQMLHAEEELPHCRALRDVEATRQWHSSEVLIVKQLDQIPKVRETSEKDYPLTSYAAWFGAEETWLWGMVQNYFVEDGYKEQEEINPEHYVVFLQRSAPLKDDPIGTKAHMTLYRDRPCELVWLQRHGRDDIHKAVVGSKVSKDLILPSRVCYRWKPTPNTGGYKAKARIVIQGFRDPHLPLLTRDAPVLSRNGMMTILQWSASYGTKLYNADAKSAFLQGLPDDERPAKIYMRPPQDKISLLGVPDWNLDILYELIAPVYGAANAPRRWYGRFRGVVESKGWKVHSLDPCLFLWKATWKEDGQDVSRVVALLGVHVDDIMVTALPDWEKD